MTSDIRNMRRRRRHTARFAAVAILGAGLVIVTRFVPRILERGQEIERLKAKNDELRWQLERKRRPEPPHNTLAEEEIRRRLKILEPGEKVFVVQAPDERLYAPKQGKPVQMVIDSTSTPMATWPWPDKKTARLKKGTRP